VEEFFSAPCEKDGVDGLTGFNDGDRISPLSLGQQATREVGAWIEHVFSIIYESRSGLIALLHRPGLEHRKSQAVSRKLDPTEQQALVDAYEVLLKTLPDDEVVMVVDAMHPTHGVRPVGCLAAKKERPAWTRPAVGIA